MKIVIDIDDDIAQGIIDGENDEPRNIVRSFQATIADAIKNGTPLPKGHGDLIDRGEVVKSLFDYHNGKKTIGQCIEDVQTIIEADKESDK